MFIVQIAMYHYDMYVKAAYDNFNNKRIMMMMPNLTTMSDF